MLIWTRKLRCKPRYFEPYTLSSVNFFSSVYHVASFNPSQTQFMIFWISTTPTCTWWNRPEEELSSDKLKSSQLYATTPTHYSTEPLTTEPNYDPLLLMLALAGDVHPNHGLSRYPCSFCFKNVTSQGTSYLCTRCSHWVHSRCSGLQNAADYRKANGWICTACMTPSRPRAPTPPPSPTHTPTMSDKSFNILQWNANGIGNKRTELIIFFKVHNVKVAAIPSSLLNREVQTSRTTP